ncbi:MAG: polysaccharide deacetylase family protein, partial [Chloroflexaceae bacterium]|nr:polysaccharide deacetylase family protein [Chloroflexaceae bacterium]
MLGSYPWRRRAGIIAAVLLAMLLLPGLLGAFQQQQDMPSAPPTPMLPMAQRHVLEQPVFAWYAPDGELYGAIVEGTHYTPITRYGDEWVQVVFAQIGELWVRVSDVPELSELDLDMLADLMPPPTPTPVAYDVADYNGAVVEAGDTLATLALQGGSEPSLIQRYNRLAGEPAAGRPLIIPRIQGRESTLPPAALIVNQGSSANPWVALTVDLETGDEPVREMLAILREYDVHITFFVLGPWVEQHPELARAIAADGHEFGNHSWSHANFRLLSDQEIAHELKQTEAVVAKVTGSTTRPLFRPPYGYYDDRVLQAAIKQGYLPIYWNVDSKDALGSTKTADFVIAQITEAYPPDQMPGVISLSHCCSRTTFVEALPGLLER